MTPRAAVEKHIDQWLGYQDLTPDEREIAVQVIAQMVLANDFDFADEYLGISRPELAAWIEERYIEYLDEKSPSWLIRALFRTDVRGARDVQVVKIITGQAKSLEAWIQQYYQTGYGRSWFAWTGGLFHEMEVDQHGEIHWVEPEWL